MRMFGPNGNPSEKNLFEVLAHLQGQEDVHLRFSPNGLEMHNPSLSGIVEGEGFGNERDD